MADLKPEDLYRNHNHRRVHPLVKSLHQLIKDEYHAFHLYHADLTQFFVLHTPKTEEEECSFGEEVQSQSFYRIKYVCAALLQCVQGFSRYYDTRANSLTWLKENPNLEDINAYLKAFDVEHLQNLQQLVLEISNVYGTLQDQLTKNWNNITKPHKFKKSDPNSELQYSLI